MRPAGDNRRRERRARRLAAHQWLRTCLRDTERIRSAYVPRSCRCFRDEYIAQDDWSRGKPCRAVDLTVARAIGALEAARYVPLPHGIGRYAPET